MTKSVKVGLSVLVFMGMIGVGIGYTNATESKSDQKSAAPADSTGKPGEATTDAKSAEQKDGAAKAEAPKSKIEAFDDWALECYDEKINGLSCQMIQRVVHDKLKQNVLVMSLSYSKERKKDIVQFVLPLDFNLIPGILVEMGDYKEVLSVNRCSAEGCYVEGGISEKFAEAMKKAKPEDKGRFILVARDDKKIAIPFSAKGFTKAYEKMLSKN